LDVDRTAPVVAASEIDIDASPEVVWDVLTTFERWPSWNPDVKTMAFGGPVAEGTTFTWKAGPGTITSTIGHVEPPHAIAWTGRTLGIDAVHVWRLEPQLDGTHVHCEESFAGMLPRLLRGPMRTMLQKGLDNGLRYLKAEAERGAHQPGGQ
jgi:uncharacterized protein YndB with AHSA1/START domain